MGAPLDFISYHAKGQTSVVEGQARMGVKKNADDADQGFQIVSSFPKFRNLPIVISESDPEGCAACAVRYYPQNDYRNGYALRLLRSRDDEEHVRTGGSREDEYRGRR